MGQNTKIQWTDHTFNPWIGCRKVAEECANCYAETLDRNRFSKTLGGGTKESPVSHWGSGPRHRTSEANWREPLKWNQKPWRCDDCGTFLAEKFEIHECGSLGRKYSAFTRRARVFCASLSDWLDDENVPIEWFADLLKLIHDTPNLDWLQLTKRPQNWLGRLRQIINFDSRPIEFRHFAFIRNWMGGIPPANIWIGVSAGADQEAALAIPAKVHFLSCEPLLRPLDTTHAARFNWIIFGGESGKNARPFHTDWLREGLDFCRANKVAPFVKQMGSNPYAAGRDQKFLIAMKDSHGGDMAEWPADLRVREFPNLCQ